MERKAKHEVVVELLKEVTEEINRGTRKYDEELKGNHDLQELNHIASINKRLRITKEWLNKKMIELEEEV